jgi:hypothetical protein
MERRGKHASTTTELLLRKHVPAAMVTHATGKTVVYAFRAEELQRIWATGQLSSAREAEKRWRYT